MHRTQPSKPSRLHRIGGVLLLSALAAGAVANPQAAALDKAIHSCRATEDIAPEVVAKLREARLEFVTRQEHAAVLAITVKHTEST